MSARVGTTLAEPTLVRDGLALTLSAVITAGAGFVGWLVAARLVPPSEVGAASAFVSGFLLVAGICEMGLGPAMLRWLPRASGSRCVLLRRCYAVVTTAAVLGSVVFFLLPAGNVTWRTGVSGGAALFVLACVGWTLFQFQDAVLTGIGRAGWVLVENTAFSAGRLVVLVLLGPVLGASGILLSWVAPTVIGVVAVSWLVVRDARFTSADPGQLPDRHEVVRLVAPTYPTTVCMAALYHLVPLMVTHRFGTELGAVFFVVWMAVNAIDAAATGFANSLVVRLAGQPSRAAPLIRLAAKKLFLLFVPTLAGGVLLAGVVLMVFGHTYAAAGADMLRLVLLGYGARLVVMVAVAAHLAAGRGVSVAALQGGGAIGMVGVVLLAPVMQDTAQLTVLGAGYAVVQVLLAVSSAVDLARRLRYSR